MVWEWQWEGMHMLIQHVAFAKKKSTQGHDFFVTFIWGRPDAGLGNVGGLFPWLMRKRNAWMKRTGSRGWPCTNRAFRMQSREHELQATLEIREDFVQGQHDPTTEELHCWSQYGLLPPGQGGRSKTSGRPVGLWAWICVVSTGLWQSWSVVCWRGSSTGNLVLTGSPGPWRVAKNISSFCSVGTAGLLTSPAGWNGKEMFVQSALT